jgi:hypothetical protein
MEKKKKVKEWEINKKIQDVWVAKLPWAEAMLGANGKVNMVKCCVCSQIERSFWFPSLIASKNMLRSTITRLQIQIAMWGDITCQLNHTCKG